VPRERLFRTLDKRSLSPITWLHALAGSGKTTLLSTYLRVRQVPVLWYDVDAGDADVSSVFHYTRLAAQALLGAEVELPVPRPGMPDGQCRASLPTPAKRPEPQVWSQGRPRK